MHSGRQQYVLETPKQEINTPLILHILHIADLYMKLDLMGYNEIYKSS